MRATLLGLTALLLSTRAHADMLPDGEKGLGLSILVEAEVPACKTLILANTFRGADIITPGAAQKVEWHPMAGAMQLRLIDSGKVAAIEAARADLDRDKIKPLLNSAPACGEPLQGVRTIADTSIAEELRWSLRVKITGGACSSTLLRTDYLDAGGKVVDPKTTAPTAADMHGPPSDPPPPADAPTSPPPAAPAPAPAPASKPTPAPATSGCRLAGDASLVALLAPLLLLRRRR